MDERLHRIRIESQDVGRFQVFIDGKPLYGVTKLAVKLANNKFPVVELEIAPGSIEMNELPFFTMGEADEDE